MMFLTILRYTIAAPLIVLLMPLWVIDDILGWLIAKLIDCNLRGDSF